tara:strand:+ start:239 stop:508 length:270 start_codon:yes stop_codon:yes gene_type:complete
MKVENMTNSRGNKVKNQFIITGDLGGQWFQSYDSVIVSKHSDNCIYLDKNYWNYSRTTSKYRNIFLNETTKETEAKIKDGTYSLIDLNK